MRLIDADALFVRLAEYHAHSYGKVERAYGEAIEVVQNAPTIDAVPVVCCKDCKHRGSPYSCPMRKLVMPFSGAGAYEDCTEDNGYCHMGEREADDATGQS